MNRTMKPMRRTTATVLGAALLILGTTTPAGARPAEPVTSSGSMSLLYTGGLPYRSSLPPVEALYIHDNVLYRPGAVILIYPGPAVMPLEQTKLRPDTVRSVLRQLYAASATPKGGWGSVPTSEGAATRIEVSFEGRSRVAHLAGLGLPRSATPRLSSAQYYARERLARAIDRVSSLRGTSTMFKPSRLDAWATPYDPSSNFNEYNTWPAELPWPGPGLQEGCTTLAASLLPAAANDATLWRDGDTLWNVYFRPVPPGQSPCSDNGFR